MPNLTAGKGIGFKVGTQNSVNSILNGNSSAVPGSFYLAEDTHRLYIGNDDQTLSPVNEGVIVVSSISDLPTLTAGGNNSAYQGQFYYITGTGSNADQNILCVCSGDKWVQINPDTYLYSNQHHTSLSSSVSNGITTATITDTIRDTGGTIQHTSVGEFSIRGSANLNVAVDTTGRVITLSAPDGAKYSLLAATEVANNSVKLTLNEIGSDPAVTYDVILQKGNGGVTPVLSTDANTGNPIITFNGGGFVGAQSAFTISENNGQIELRITDGAGNAKFVQFTPKIKIGSTEQEVTFSYDTTSHDLVADLNVYTIPEIDAMLANVLQSTEAMYFAGTIGSNGTTENLATLKNLTNISSGATFKFISAITDSSAIASQLEGWDSNGAQVGDLLIITGVEDSQTGYINMAAATTKYTYVPSGDDLNSYYKPDLTTAKQISFTKNTDGGVIPNSDAHTLSFAQGNDIVVSGVVSNGTNGGKNQVITIAHETMTAPSGSGTNGANPQTDITTSAASTDYTAIVGLTLDNGHVTGFDTQKITITHNRLQRVATAASAVGSVDQDINRYWGVQFGQTYTDTQNNSVTPGTANNNYFGLNSETLSFTVTNAGSATGTGNSQMANVNIEMVWGSF